jgi:predicted RNA-binding protein YlxR (DUF448 family)
MPPRKPPMRLCLGCNTSRPKRELIRIVRTPEGTVEVDPKGKRNGRGAYVCPSRECLEKAARGRLQHALAVPLPEEVLDALRQSLP